MLRKSYSWTLVYILPISPFSVLQCEIVSFLLLSFSISLCFIDFVFINLVLYFSDIVDYKAWWKDEIAML